MPGGVLAEIGGPRRIVGAGDARPDQHARPKSSTLTRPGRCTITFDGLMSRCTRPCACASAERQGDLAADVEDAIERERSGVGQLGERPAGDVLHRDEADAAAAGLDFVDFVDDGDVGVWSADAARASASSRCDASSVEPRRGGRP